MNLNIGVGGKFRIVAIRPDGTQRVLADWFDNLILNQGLDRIGTMNICVSTARVGSGTTPPLVTDTNLYSPIASTTTKQGAVLGGNSSSAPYYGWQRATFRFSTGAAAGNISEVGVGWGTASGQLFSRALVKNSNGDPITITVLSDEILDVTYELRFYAPVADAPYTMTIAGIEYTGVARPSSVTTSDWQPGAPFTTSYSPQFTAHSGSIGTVTQSPSGTSEQVTPVWGTYVADSYKRTASATFGLPMGNFGAGGIQAFKLRTPCFGSYQFSLSPAIPKDATKVLSINIEVSWSRYTPV